MNRISIIAVFLLLSYRGYSQDWRYVPGKKVYKSLKEAFSSKEKVYNTDADKKIIKNQYNQPVHTLEYSKAFHEALNGMVEKQMRGAIAATANYWYTAWVNAGKPDLTSLDSDDLTNRNKKYLKEDMKAWTKGKITNLKIQNE